MTVLPEGIDALEPARTRDVGCLSGANDPCVQTVGTVAEHSYRLCTAIVMTSLHGNLLPINGPFRVYS